MDKVYKLTDQNGYTCNRTHWEPGVTHTATGSGGLCTSGCIHAYRSPELAAMVYPIHMEIENPRLWLGEMEILHDDGLKVGGRSLTIVKELRFPAISHRQRVCFAILCAKTALENLGTPIPVWNRWAEAFLTNPRIEAAARAAWAAARAARAASEAARAASEAARAASEAAWAARVASEVAWAAEAARVARVASEVAWAAEAARVASEVAWAAEAAGEVAWAAEVTIDFVSIAKKAMEY